MNAPAGTLRKKRHPFLQSLVKQRELWLLCVPIIVWVAIFCYYPMYGLLMAFVDYVPGREIWQCDFVGLKYFARFVTGNDFPRLLRNTLAMSGLSLTVGFVCPILFAFMLNELGNLKIKKFVQTASYLPHFISWVVCATLMFDLMSTDGGAINEFLMWIGVIKEPIGFFTEGKYFWGITLCTDIWKELGWNAIIFISAITSISQDMYEAADIDGATRAQKMWHITIKSIKPTIILMFIFQVGGILNANFDQIMMLTKQMGNSMLKEYADVLDTFIYRLGVSQGRFSFAAAAGLFKSIVNFALLLGSNYVAGKFGEAQLF